MPCTNHINSSGSWVRPTFGKHWQDIGRREGGTLGHLFAQLATSLNQKIRLSSKQPFLYNFLSLFILLCLVTKLCPSLVWPLRLCLPGFSVRGVFQARVPEGFPSPAYLPNPAIKPGFPALQADFFTTESLGKFPFFLFHSTNCGSPGPLGCRDDQNLLLLLTIYSTIFLVFPHL